MTIHPRYLIPILVSLVSIGVSMNFLDPINWPKMILLLTLLPLIVYQCIKGQTLKTVFLSFKNLIGLTLIVAFIALVTVFISNSENLTRTLWGLWGRSNGLLTTFALIILAGAIAYGNAVWNFQKNAVQVLAIVMGVVAAYGWIQEVGLDPLAWSKSDTVFGLFGNTNFASACWAIGAVASLGSFLAEKSWSIKGIFVACFLLSSTASWLTDSIQGPVAILIGAFLLITLYGIRGQRKKTFALISTLPMGLFLVYSSFGSGPFGDILYQYTMRLRSFYWLTGIRIGNSSPWNGVGPDSYGDFYRIFRTEEMAKTTSIDLIANNAHNAIIQIYATMGILGLIAILPLLLLAVLHATKLIINKDFRTFSYEITCSVVLICLLLISLVSIDNISVAVWVYFFAGIALSSRLNVEILKGTKSFSRKRAPLYNTPKMISVSMALVLFFISWTSSYPDRAILATLRTPAFEDNQESLDARKERLLEILKSRNLMEGQYGILSSAFTGVKDYGLAIYSLDVATRKYPKDFPLLSQLAFLESDYGSKENAIAIRLKMIKMDPRHAVSYLALALDYEQFGQNEEAKLSAAKAQLNSGFLTSEQLLVLDKLEERLQTKPVISD